MRVKANITIIREVEIPDKYFDNEGFGLTLDGAGIFLGEDSPLLKDDEAYVYSIEALDGEVIAEW